MTAFDGHHFRVTYEDGDVEDYTAKELAKIAVPNSEMDTKLPSSSAKADSTSNETGGKLYAQPDAIQAELRDYQLAGLNWMIKMHRRNLGMILGDEMGLVSLKDYRRIISTVTFPHSRCFLVCS